MGTDMTETGKPREYVVGPAQRGTTRKEKDLPGELRSINTEQCEATM
jgi:hypothetical protein